MDEKSFCNDFVNLAHSMGVFLYEDLLCIMSLRYQTIHILQVRDSGNLVDVRNIGSFCLEDDELFLSSHAQVSFFHSSRSVSCLYASNQIVLIKYSNALALFLLYCSFSFIAAARCSLIFAYVPFE